MAGNRRIIMMVAATALATGALGTTHAQCPPRYEITTILPGPNCGIFGTGAVFGKAMNDLGHITGSVYCAFGGEAAFVWYGSGPWQLIPNPPGVTVLDSRGVDITSDGKVLVRINEGNGGGGFVYDGVTSTMLPPAPPQGTYFDPYEFDGSGDVVAGTWGNNVEGPGRSALRIVDGQMELLEGLLGTSSSAGRAANDQGWITGWRGSSQISDARAFILDGDKVTDLGVIPGGVTADPNAINNLGQVTGRGRMLGSNGEVTYHAFFWDGEQMLDLGVVAAWGRSTGLDVSDSGIVVGALTEPGSDAFMWLDGTMWDLDDIVEHPGLFNIRAARGILNDGRILCEAWIDGETYNAVVLSPIQRPDTDLNDDCVTNVLDLLALLGLWGDTGGLENAGDFNNDETVNVLDLLILLGQWGA